MSLSTGLLFRRLLTTTLSELAAFTVGGIWLGSDLLHCLAITSLLKDALVFIDTENETLVVVRGKQLSILDCIIIVFSLFYLFDFLLVLNCHFASRHYDCEASLSYYRHIFFHIQLHVSILYLSKPWRWSEIDLREILARLRRFIQLVYGLCSSIAIYLNHNHQVEIGTIDPNMNNINRRGYSDNNSRSSRTRKTSASHSSRAKGITRSNRAPRSRANGYKRSISRSQRLSKDGRTTKVIRRSRGSSAIEISQQSGNLVRVEVVQ